jgi:uncharacterized membrane protein
LLAIALITPAAMLIGFAFWWSLIEQNTDRQDADA